MFWQVTQQLLEGFESTLKLFCITLVAALPLGLIISFGSMSKFRPLKWLCAKFRKSKRFHHLAGRVDGV